MHRRVVKSKALYVSFAIGSVLSTLVLTTTGCGSASQAAGPGGGAAMPPPLVDVAPVVKEPVRLFSEWVATIDGSVNAQIQPQVMGYLVRQNYTEGAAVRKGDVLFEIDPRPFQAIVDQAKGQVAQAESGVAQAESTVRQAESQVAQAEAQSAKAALDVKRDTPLAAAHAIPQSQLDTEVQALAAADAGVKAARANVGTAQAAVKSANAQVVAARASLAQAELNLSFTHVRSLVDGVAGVAQTQIGNLVKTDTVLTTVSQVNPIRVYFPISEKEYLALVRKGGSLTAQGGGPALELVLTDGTVFPHKGRLTFVDRQVDPATGTIRVAANFDNPGNVLRPGAFGRIRALTAVDQDALLVPQRAVIELQGKFQLAVVGADNKVQLRNVTLGPEQGSRYIVQSGVREGEKIVVEGLARAQNGAQVTPQPAKAEPKS
ncbi:MAG: efflux RND transporter periplasmic adaptor subunit [Acidobacteria bacterium]|nr:efflux RND transporter periplasmic adaptor subunit [Acidobacteriota bacterium]